MTHRYGRSSLYATTGDQAFGYDTYDESMSNIGSNVTPKDSTLRQKKQ
jgi:hypothetical protein